MNFTLHQLKIFLEVVRYENITKAAEEMYMTQPALSIQIKNLQKQFDIPLVEKIGKRIYITDFGYKVADIAERILLEAESLKYKTREYKGLLTGKLKISSASTGKYVIPYFLSGFMQQHPGIDLTLDVSNKTRVVESLKKNEIDFALVSVLPEDVKVQEHILIENKLYLIGNDNLYTADSPLIYREEGSATRKAMDGFFFRKQSQRKSMELTSNEAVKQAVLAGLGYSILPLIGIGNELKNKKLHIIPSSGLPITTYWRLVWLDDKKPSPIASAFLEYIQDAKESIVQEHFDWCQAFD